MEKGIWKNKVKEHALVILCFIVFTFLLTYPVITQVATHAAGVGGDGFCFKWFIWHAQKTLTEGGGISDLYHTDYQYYPYGTSLAFDTLSLTNTLFLAFPLTLIIDNLVLIYNILFFFNFILAGYAMYLLVRYLIKDRAIAFLVGFAYAFSPLHMLWGWGHLNLMSIGWIPLFLLFFFKMFEEQKISNALIAAVLLFFLTLASWYHIVHVFCIAALYFLYKLFTNRRLFNGPFFFRAAVFLFIYGIIILPFLAPVISEYLNAENDYYNMSLETGMSPLNYIWPNMLHPIWGNTVRAYFRQLVPGHPDIPGEDHFFPSAGIVPGYLVLVLSLFYVIKTRKHFFWLLLVLFFFGLSVAPRLDLLASWLNSLPIFSVLRTTAKFAVCALFSFLILFAFALQHFLPKWKAKLSQKLSLSTKATQIILIGVILAWLLFEYLAVPYKTTSNYQNLELNCAEKIGQALQAPHPVFGDNAVVLGIPPDTARQYYLYFQTFHEKKTITGYTSRPIPASRQAIEEITMIIQDNDAEAFLRFLESYRIGYIILYKNETEAWGMKNNVDFLFGQVPLRLIGVYQDDIRKYRQIYIFETFPEGIPEEYEDKPQE